MAEEKDILLSKLPPGQFKVLRNLLSPRLQKRFHFEVVEVLGVLLSQKLKKLIGFDFYLHFVCCLAVFSWQTSIFGGWGDDTASGPGFRIPQKPEGGQRLCDTPSGLIGCSVLELVP